MKKAIFIVMAICTIFAMVLGMAGCSNSTDPTPNPNPNNPNPNNPNPNNPTGEWTVTFDANGGTFAQGAVTTVKVLNNGVLGNNIPSATKGTDTLDSWNTKADGSGDSYDRTSSITKDVTLYAQWRTQQENQWKITFDLNYTDAPGTQDVLVTKGESMGTKYPAPPTRDGYAFTGWYDNPSGTGTSYTNATPINDNKNLFAKWEEVKEDQVVVTFDAIGGTFRQPDDQSRILKKGADLGDMPVVTRENEQEKYTFDGWFDAASGGALYDQYKKIDADITLYAHWTLYVASTNAVLSTVKFDQITASLGVSAAKLENVTTAGKVVLLKDSANVTATTVNDQATIEFWTDKGEGEDPTDAWWPLADDHFGPGDVLCIKVTAEDRETVAYYKIEIALADVILSSLKIGGKDVTIPNAATSPGKAIAGNVLFGYRLNSQPAGGLQAVALPDVADSEVKYGHATGSNEPTFSYDDTFTYADSEFLYIEVTTASGGKGYYKVQVNFMQTGEIKYGSPQVSTDHSIVVVDSLWDDPELEIYPINKLYQNDCSADFIAVMNGEDPADYNVVGKTIAWAKALWDEEGIYIYLDVTDPDMSESDAEHNTDSFELFVNEGPVTGTDPNNVGVYANANANGGGSQ